MYTAEELIWATQLAYCNFTEFHAAKKFYVREVFQETGYKIFYNYDPDETPTGDFATMREETEQFIRDVQNGEKCKDWKIVDIKDDQDNTGLYAIVIETG
ncbi:MAG: hypothetical protein NC091_13635, partial [Bacteroides sp.]|nr:hypothetical protein [Bacteroides sp.]